MSSLTKQNRFLLAVALQVAVILGIIVFKLSVLAGGTSVILNIQPVDPTDPLRGDYVTLRYDINNIPYYNVLDYDIRNGDQVYVMLEKSGRYWIAQSVEKDKPKAEDGEVFIKGTVMSGAEYLVNRGGASRNTRLAALRIEYGIEEYFIPEGSGRNFRPSSGNTVGEVMVDKDGNAMLKQLYVNDKPWP